MNKKNKEVSTIRSSAAEYLTFVASSGHGGVEAINVDENLVIKKFSSNHLEQVFKLGLGTYGEDESTPLESLESLSELFFGEDGYYFGTIEFNGEFVGYLCLYEKSLGIISLGDIVIKNEFRGRRFSERTISALLNEIFKAKTYEKVELTVRKGNLAAIKCYKKLNFKIIETLPEYYLDKEDALKMVFTCQV
jgi:ribosomal protein S18 acetylase RimI-like enzyme